MSASPRGAADFLIQVAREAKISAIAISLAANSRSARCEGSSGGSPVGSTRRCWNRCNSDSMTNLLRLGYVPRVTNVGVAAIQRTASSTSNRPDQNSRRNSSIPGCLVEANC
jgi:hypothetical protein